MADGRQGRPANTQPAIAYDYRRYITLVQVLALGDYGAMCALYESWGLEPMPEPDTLLMVYRLAEHATNYHRSDDATPTRRS